MSTVTREELHEVTLQKPTYKWIAQEEDAQDVSPIKRPIAKLQEAHAEFTVYQAYQAIGQLEDGIRKRDEQSTADRATIELYRAELDLIQSALGIDDLEKQYQNEKLAEIAVSNKPE
jgi:hypothetical protein